ncbi:MAG TPA: hypothetical protein VJ761_06510, partial [Ktedonobacteraceae bacterium]|nr:hypothetical protein [Ktedonobacteraceae bacterium]
MNPESQPNIVETHSRFKLIQEPQPLLREGRWQAVNRHGRASCLGRYIHYILYHRILTLSIVGTRLILVLVGVPG